MKKLIAVVVAVMILAMAGSAMAATATGTMNVAATVNSSCTVGTITNLAFGTLDPSANSLVAATPSTVNFTCTNGTSVAVQGDYGTHFVGTQANLSNGTTSIPYSYTIGAVPSANGTAQSFQVTGSIAAGTYGTATAGTYADAVVITLTY